MRANLVTFLAGLALAGCNSSAPSPTPTAPTPPPTALAPAKMVPVDVAQAQKDFVSAKTQAGYAECAKLKIPAASQTLVDQGRDLYASNCASCHGPEGLGDGPAGLTLDPKPRNLTRPAEYKYGFRELALFRTIKHGIQGSGMAGWEGRMTDEDTWKVALFVRGLQKP